MGLLNALEGAKIYLDTSPLIYFIEDIAPYASMPQPLFKAIDQGTVQGVTEEIALAESLVHPFRAHNHAFIQLYLQALQDRLYFCVSAVRFNPL